MAREPIIQTKPSRDVTDTRVIRALAHPLRVAALRLLEKQTMSPKDLAAELGVPLPLASYHVRRLHQLDLIELVGTEQRRGALQHFYRTRPRAKITDEAWAEVPVIVKHELLAATLSQSNAEIGAAVTAGGFDRADVHLSRTSFETDEEGWREISQLLLESLEQMEDIQVRATERLAEAGAESHPVTRATAVMMLFEAASGVAAGDDCPDSPRSSPSRD